MANLLGSTSQIAAGSAMLLGGALTLSSVATAATIDPVAPCDEVIICSGPAYSPQELTGGTITVLPDFSLTTSDTAFSVSSDDVAIDLSVGGLITSADGVAVNVEHTGAAATTIVLTDTAIIHGHNGGVYAHGMHGNVNVSNAGSVSGFLDAIYAATEGLGDVSITNDGDAIGEEYGLHARASGVGNISITSMGNVTQTLSPSDSADLAAIRASQYGAGGVAIVVGGAGLDQFDAPTTTISAARTGISIQTDYYSAGDLGVNVGAGALIDAGSAGIDIVHSGESGDIRVDVDGEIVSGGPAINVNSYASGDITVDMGGALSVSEVASAIIVQNNYGGGNSTITVDGTITGDLSEESAIVAIQAGLGNIQIETSTTTEITDFMGGISASHSSQGDITIDHSGTISRSDPMHMTQIGVGSEHSGIGNIDIRNSGSISQAGVALVAWHEGRGLVSIANSGTLNNVAFGILASRNGSGDVVISNEGTISEATEAIVVTQSGHGNTSVTNDSDLLNGDRAIVVERFTYDDGDDVIRSIGDVTISNTAMIGNQSSAGIELSADLIGDATITNSGTITDTGSGITARHVGVGDLTVENSGDILNSSFAIYTQHELAGDVTVTNSGNIENSLGGIGAFHAGRGAISVANTGAINAHQMAVLVAREGVGDVSVSHSAVASITGANAGINVMHFGDGDVTINSLGAITDTTNAITAYLEGHGDLRVTNGGVIGYDPEGIKPNDYGVRAGHDGVGNLYLTNSSSIDSRYSAVIAAHDGTGDIVLDLRGTLSSQIDSTAYVVHEGIGNIRGTINATIMTPSGDDDSEDDAISINHAGSGDIDLSIGGSITSDQDGIYVSTNATGASDIRLDISANIIASSDAVDVNNDDSDGGINLTIRSALHAGDNGIEIDNESGSGTTVNLTSTGSILAEDHAMQIENESGDVNVTITGEALSVNNAIEIENDGDAVTVTATGMISSKYSSAIDIAQGGFGLVDISVNTALSGVDPFSLAVSSSFSSRAAVHAYNYSDQGIRFSGNGTIIGHAGISLWADGGAINMSLGKEALVAGYGSFAIEAGSYQNEVGTEINLVSDGMIWGGIDFSYTDATDSASVTINGYWDSRESVSYLSQGDDTIFVNGTWNARNATINFDGAPLLLTMFTPFAVGPTADVTVNAGGTLIAGETTFTALDNLTVHGTFDMVNGLAVETVQTNGNVVLAQSSTLRVDLDDTGGDLLTAGGNIDLEGGKLVVNYLGNGGLAVGDSYTILSATEVTGAFGSTELMSSAFLGWAVSSDSNTITLTYDQLRTMRSIAGTPNQVETAGALESLAGASALYSTVLNLETEEAALAAFDQLAGDVHPGVRTAMSEDSRLSRNAVLTRLQDRADTRAIWGQVIRSAGESDGDKSQNIASLDRNTWGYLLGADVAVSDVFTVGVAGAYLNNKVAQATQGASAKVDSYQALAYAGARTGIFAAKVGAGYAWGDVRSTRSVSIADFSDTLRADYNASVFQTFAEASARFGIGGGYVEPILGLAHVAAATGAFSEKGGDAALSAAKESQKTTISTLGARFATAERGIFSVRAMLGWQHNFDAKAPTTRFRFTDSDGFTIAGAAQSRNSAAANLEANFKLSNSASLGLGYEGVIGKRAQDHAAKVRVNIAF